jgi:hypothetical protein
VWFDRALRPPHLLFGTRGGDAPAALIDYLERTAADVAALSPRTDAA